MAVVRWSPFRELLTLRDAMDRMFEPDYTRPTQGGGVAAARALSLDVYETGEDVVVKAALPGAKPEDVDVNVTGDTLTLKGRIRSDAELQDAQKWNWVFHELWYGEVARSITLPSPVQADKAEASFDNGILILRLPKLEEIKPRQIKIKTRETIEAK